MDLGLSNRVAAVAAASDGLGKAVATLLAREGASVAICSRSSERIEKAAAEIEAAARASGRVDPVVLPLAADLATGEGPGRFIEETLKRLERVDILVANNGGPPPGIPTELDEEKWRAGVDLTFMSAVRLAREVIPGMRQRRWGRIIFITSVSVKQPIETLAISTALRCGVVGFAKSLADELAADGITVNSLAPGSTATSRLEELLTHRAARDGISVEEAREALARQSPMRRIGRPEEFAAAAAFLASEQAAYITGTVLPVDGGQCRSIT